MSCCVPDISIQLMWSLRVKQALVPAIERPWRSATKFPWRRHPAPSLLGQTNHPQQPIRDNYPKTGQFETLTIQMSVLFWVPFIYFVSVLSTRRDNNLTDAFLAVLSLLKYIIPDMLGFRETKTSLRKGCDCGILWHGRNVAVWCKLYSILDIDIIIVGTVIDCCHECYLLFIDCCLFTRKGCDWGSNGYIAGMFSLVGSVLTSPLTFIHPPHIPSIAAALAEGPSRAMVKRSRKGQYDDFLYPHIWNSG